MVVEDVINEIIKCGCFIRNAKRVAINIMYVGIVLNIH